MGRKSTDFGATVANSRAELAENSRTRLPQLTKHFGVES